MTALFAAIYSYQKKEWTWGSFFLSCGMAIKMNLLLVLPAVSVILYQALSFSDLLMQGSVIFQVQVSARRPFFFFLRLTRVASTWSTVSTWQLEGLSHESF